MNIGGNKMRTEKDNGSRERYIMGVVVAMIILQIVLIYSVLSGIVYQDANDSFNEVIVEEVGSSNISSNKLLTQSNDIKIEIGKITLIAILMVGTGYLMIIKEGFGEEECDKETCVQITQERKEKV